MSTQALEIKRERWALVYEDEGVSSTSAQAIAKQLRECLPLEIGVKTVNSSYLRQEDWHDRAIVLAVGGGSCSTWEKELGKEGMEKIHQFVAEKGKFYLGFCAGGAFPLRTRFQKDSKWIEKERPCCFSSAVAIFPPQGISSPFSPKSAKAPRVTFQQMKSQREGALYYLGGCYFQNDPEDAYTDVILTYRKFAPEKAAALLCRVGKAGGSAFLCGLHPEFEWTQELAQMPSIGKLAKKLVKHEKFRRNLWQFISRLILRTK